MTSTVFREKKVCFDRWNVNCSNDKRTVGSDNLSVCHKHLQPLCLQFQFVPFSGRLAAAFFSLLERFLPTCVRMKLHRGDFVSLFTLPRPTPLNVWEREGRRIIYTWLTNVDVPSCWNKFPIRTDSSADAIWSKSSGLNLNVFLYFSAELFVSPSVSQHSCWISKGYTEMQRITAEMYKCTSQRWT